MAGIKRGGCGLVVVGVEFKSTRTAGRNTQHGTHTHSSPSSTSPSTSTVLPSSIIPYLCGQKEAYNITMRIAAGAAALLSVVATADAFVAPRSSRVKTTKLQQTGGWGIGPQRELTPEEFGRGERRAFEGYNLRDRGEFMRQVARDKDDLVNSELDELLGVAVSAGIKVKDPSERLGKFDLGDDNEENLDVSVQWDEDSDESRSNDDSVTRFDEDTGASGVW